MNPILETTRFVVDNSKKVKINKDKIGAFCSTFTSEHQKHWWKAAPQDLSKFNKEQKLQFLFLFNAISFCYWGEPKWTVEYNAKQFDGSWGMITALARAVDEQKSIFDAHYLAAISKDEFAHLLRANNPIPLLEERWKIIREVGTVLLKKYNGELKNVIKEANNDALQLLNIIINNFPSFADSEMYKGKKIFFHKRAQLLVGDVYNIFQGKSYGTLKNTEELTACADYKLPFALRKRGILSYTHNVAQKNDSKQIIEKGSETEIEIRANTIWAVELIRQELKKRIPDITATHINDHLWLTTQEKSAEDKPYHRTITTSY